MENNLDNFFKKKLENREFKMEDAYWADMEQMIEAEEKGNDRKFLWAWLLGGLLLVTMLVGGYFWNAASRSTAAVDQTIINTNTTAIKEQTPTQAATNVSETKEKNPIEVSESKAGTQIEMSNSNNKNTNASASQNTVSNKNADVVKIDAAVLKGNQQPKNKIDNNTNTNSLRQSATKPFLTSTNENKTLENSNPTGVNIYPTTYLQKENKNKVLINPTEVVPNSSETILKEDSKIPPNQKIEKKEKEEVAKKPIAGLLNIPSLDILAQIDRVEDLPNLTWANMKKKKFSMGIIAGIASFPFEQDSIKSTTGYKVGLTARYKLKRNVALNADLMYFYRGGEFNPIQDGEEVTYSFGRTTDRYELTANSVHYLEMPVYLTYTKNKHIFEGGVSASYLLGVRGGRFKIPNEGPRVAAGDPYWLDNSGFRKLNTNVALGYRYQIAPNLHFGVRGVYALGSVMQQSDLFAGIGAERTQFSSDSRLHLNFKLTQYLF